MMNVHLRDAAQFPPYSLLPQLEPTGPFYLHLVRVDERDFLIPVSFYVD